MCKYASCSINYHIYLIQCIYLFQSPLEHVVTLHFYVQFLVLLRILRNIGKCLREILDVLLILLFVIAIFALMGKVYNVAIYCLVS